MIDEQNLQGKVWKVNKAWQSADCKLILQLSFAGIPSKAAPIKKFFLEIDARQASFGMRLVGEKPSFKPISSAFINIWRKYCRSPIITDIVEDSKSGNIYLMLIQSTDEKPQVWYLALCKSRPPEFDLVNAEYESLVRHGMKGTYTKRKPFQDQIPDSAGFAQASEFKAQVLKELLENIPSPSDDDEHLTETEIDLEVEDQQLSSEQRNILSRLKRRLKTVKKSFTKQVEQIPKASEVSLAEQKARLLQNYAYLIRPSDFEIVISPEMSGLDQELRIEIEPDLGVGPNLESLFKRAKKLEKARRLGIERERKNRGELARLEADIQTLSSASLSEADLAVYYQRYKLSKEISQPKFGEIEAAKPFKTYRSSSGHTILVGKGPSDNDILTKSAKANDYWLHAAGAAGSHVVIPAQKDIRDQLPESLLKEAAILALHFSKFKSNLAGETYVARKADIKKRKGMPPGLWNVERCKTMFFRYQKEDLEAILNRLQAG